MTNHTTIVAYRLEEKLIRILSAILTLNLQATFNALPKWINEVKENASPSVKLVLLGNKCDLKRGDKDNLEVDFHEAKV